MRLLKMPLILLLLLILALSGCMPVSNAVPSQPADSAEEDGLPRQPAASGQSPAEFDILTLALELPFKSTVEELLEYDPTATLAYTASPAAGPTYYMAGEGTMLRMRGCLLYYVDVDERFWGAEFHVPNSSINQFFDALAQLSQMTEGELSLSVIDGDIRPLEASEEEELRRSGDVVPSGLILETYSVHSLLKEYEGSALRLSLRGADHLMLPNMNLGESIVLPDPLTSELILSISPPPEV